MHVVASEVDCGTVDQKTIRGKSSVNLYSFASHITCFPFQIDPSGTIVTIDSVVPWKAHLFSIEKEQNIEGAIKYFLYNDNAGNWRIQCVPISEHSFTNRLSLLDEWHGLRDDELSNKAQIPGLIFVHASGFIGGAKTYESVLQMARRSLK